MTLVKFGDVITINPKEKLPKGTSAPKVAMEGIQPFTKYISSYVFEEYVGGTKFRNGDTLLARITPSLENGKTSIVSELPTDSVGFGSTEFLVFRATNQILPDYLYYLTTTPNFRDMAIKSMTGTSGRQRVQTDVVSDYEFNLPSIEQQKSVVDKLVPLDAKIRSNNQINDNLLELASTLFEGSFPNVRGGENTIGTFMSNFDKQRKPLSKNQRAQRQGEYRYIGATSVVDHVDDFTFDGIYLLLGEDGTVQTDDGKPVLQYVWGPFWPNNHTHVLQGKGVSTEWLYLFWKNQNITSIITGAVQPKISQGNMNSIKVTKPSDVELATFQQKIDPIFNMIRLNADEIENLKVIRNQLLKELLG